MDFPHLEVHLFQVPHPLCCVKQRTTQPNIFQLLTQPKALGMIQTQLHCFLFILLQSNQTLNLLCANLSKGML